MSDTELAEAALREFSAARGTGADVVTAWYHVWRASRELVTELERRFLRPEGLTFRGYVSLMTLWMRGELEVHELARAQMVSRAAIVQSVNTLERRGLVEREQSATDRRRVVVRATATGVNLAERVHVQARQFEIQITPLSAEEVTTLVDLLRRLNPKDAPT